MRNAFIEALIELAQHDERIVLVTGDLGYSFCERFGDKYPNRYYNLGISEQNIMGVAAGLALCGKKVFTYSIATFATNRPYEQVRIDIGFQHADVVIVGDRHDGPVLDHVAELSAPDEPRRGVLLVVVTLIARKEQQVGVLLLEIIDDRVAVAAVVV